MTGNKTLRLSKSDLWLLLDALEHLYQSGEFDRDHLTHIEQMLSRFTQELWRPRV